MIGVSSAQFSCSVVSNSLDPMGHSTPGLPVHHQLPQLAQTHVHWVGDAIQPSHPLMSLSPPAINRSQHQGLFKWVSIRWPKYWRSSFNDRCRINNYTKTTGINQDWPWANWDKPHHSHGPFHFIFLLTWNHSILLYHLPFTCWYLKTLFKSIWSFEWVQEWVINVLGSVFLQVNSY